MILRTAGGVGKLPPQLLLGSGVFLGSIGQQLADDFSMLLPALSLFFVSLRALPIHGAARALCHAQVE